MAVPVCCSGPRSTDRRSGGPSAARFGLVAGALAIAAALLAARAPVGFSLVTVFLFAGPHNWMELRFFLQRMPARWGHLRRFFVPALVGCLGLTAGFALLPWLVRWGHGGPSAWVGAVCLWDTALLVWIAALVHLRGLERKGRDWSWVWAPCGLAAALVWIFPLTLDVALVYLHPLMALAFLQRELRRRRPEWLGAYYGCLAVVPLLLAALWWQLAGAPPLPGQDAITLRLTRHAGAALLPDISSHLLASAHAFLEMLHYGVWLAAIPAVSVRAKPWNLESIPLGKRSRGWALAIGCVVGAGALVVVALWAGFLADYPATRDVYFTVAMLHVLAEVPFFLRSLG